MASNGAIEKDGFLPHSEHEKGTSTLSTGSKLSKQPNPPIGKARERMISAAKERQHQWVQKLVGVRRRLQLFTFAFDTIGVVGIVALLMAGFQNSQSDKRFSDDVDDSFRDEDSFPQFVPIVAQTASVLLSVAFIIQGGSPWSTNKNMK
eukprot:CAMPEP_0185267298 /NCGR_PEP_ID=MMETSP1359-20130426/33989_1 /TAXON_ID=552665 /ORGANISM="Bigelowiella longifila, Strain CCMP242" /LENGTH=148 /DNA_ID=CAMNT_0027857591 /DNA_START=534 /DNA_END=980 /DNA_ORIENTATION=+